jgi:hypothetical protein
MEEADGCLLLFFGSIEVIHLKSCLDRVWFSSVNVYNVISDEQLRRLPLGLEPSRILGYLDETYN